jgi:hypothetical protein
MSFSYHRGVAPMMWVLFGLAAVEAAVVHGLVALWNPWPALILSLLSLSAMAWLILFIRSLARCPVLLGDGMLSWRCGSLRRVDVPLAQLAGIREEWDAALVKARDTFNGALIAYPNIVVDLRTPIRLGRREIVRLAHRLDDPEAFAAALAGLLREA